MSYPTEQPDARQIRVCTVYTSASDKWCGQVATPTGRCDKHDRASKWSR